MTSIAASLLCIGAGCPTAKSDIAVPANGANGESALTSGADVGSGLQQEAYRQQMEEANGGQQDAQQLQQQDAPAINADGTMDGGTDASADAGVNASASADAGVQRPPVPKSFPGVLPASRIHNKLVTIATAKGDIVFEVLDDQGPKAASNFIALAESGFYDGLTFHRVESWVVQGGDPSGDGTGGPGYTFEEETPTIGYTEGIVAMARTSRPSTNGSQFFIMTKDTPLAPDYSIFGRVIKGMDVVHAIRKGDVMTSVTVGTK